MALGFFFFKRLGKLVRYIEVSFHRKSRFNEFAEKQPNCSLYRDMVNEKFFFPVFFLFFLGCDVTLYSILKSERLL